MMKRTKTGCGLLAALLAAGLILSGCGGGAPEEKKEAADTSSFAEKDAGEEAAVSQEESPEESVSDSAAAGTPEEEASPSPEYYSVLSSFTAEDLDGNPVTEEIFAGSKVTMVNVWGTFCGPCINEMPYLGEIAASYDPEEFRIVGIVCDAITPEGTRDDAQAAYAEDIIKETGADYLHILPTGELLNIMYYLQYVPVTVFVNADGEVVSEEYVGSRSKADWEALIRSVLEQEAAEG